MASGQVVGLISHVMAPGPSIARADPGVVQAATSEENIPVLRFDDDTQEYYDLLGALEGYDGGGLTISLVWTTRGTPNSTVDWEISIRRLNAGEDISGGHTYVYQSATGTQAPAERQLVYTDLTFLNTQLDGLLNGERFIVRVTRVSPDAQQGDVELLWPAIIIRET